MIIPAIRSILPIILKSAKFTPTSKEVDVLSRLVNRMKFLRSNTSSIREAARRAVDECKQSYSVNPTVELFKNKWGWNEEKLLDVLEAIWKEIKH